jgi:hypothetical protein
MTRGRYKPGIKPCLRRAPKIFPVATIAILSAAGYIYYRLPIPATKMLRMPSKKNNPKRHRPPAITRAEAAPPATAFEFLRQNLLSFDELMQLFNVCPKTMKQYCDKYGLQGSQVGRSKMYTLQDVQAFIEKRKEKGGG